MQYRTIGGLNVSLLGLGTSRMASLGSGRTKTDARRLVDAAADCGVNVIDTADTYGSTAAERWVGELTHARADRWVVVTKTGLATVSLPGPLRAANQPLKKLKQRVRPGFDLDSRTLRRRIEASLRRLRRERIDLFLLHLPTVETAQDAELHGQLEAAVEAGLIGDFGVSTEDVATLHVFGDDWGRTCAQIPVNPLSPAAEAGLEDFDLIANHSIVDGASARSPQLPAWRREDNRDRYRLLLRHAAAVPGVKVVLTGTSSVQHLLDNAAALQAPVGPADLLR